MTRTKLHKRWVILTYTHNDLDHHTSSSQLNTSSKHNKSQLHKVSLKMWGFFMHLYAGTSQSPRSCLLIAPRWSRVTNYSTWQRNNTCQGSFAIYHHGTCPWSPKPCQCSRTQLVKGQILPQTKHPTTGATILKVAQIYTEDFPNKATAYWNFANKQDNAKWYCKTIQKNKHIKTIPKNIPQKPSNHNQLQFKHHDSESTNDLRFQLLPAFHAKWPRHSCYSPGRLAHPDLR